MLNKLFFEAQFQELPNRRTYLVLGSDRIFQLSGSEELVVGSLGL